MSCRTTCVGVLGSLALALAPPGCGAGPDMSPGNEADPKVGSVAEALTTTSGIITAGTGNRRDWANGTATMFISTQDAAFNPTNTHAWSALLDIINNNQGRLHMRKIQIDLTCSSESRGGGTQIQTEFMFSGYVNPSETFERRMLCPWLFGFPYLVSLSYYTESSYGD